MTNKKIFQFILLSLFIFIILFYKDILYYFKNNVENFDVVVPYEHNLENEQKYPTTIYENSIKNIFGSYQTMICNILPTQKENSCLINGEPIIKYKFPVHVIKMVDGAHLAVFNDGRIYKKRSLIDKMWQGPLKNSQPNRDIPLRMITLNPEGNKLIGIGYDNKGYIKLDDPNTLVSTETEWQEITGLDDVIWLGFKYDDASNQNKMIIINTDGKIMLSNTDNPLNGFIDASIIEEPVLKLYFDNDGYMMAINNKFELKVFEHKDWMISNFSKKYPGNTIPVNDIIYDYDGKLFGVVFLPKVGQCEIMKQEDLSFMSPFVPFELNRTLDARLNKKITDRHIIKSKLGIFTKNGLVEEDTLDNDINVAYQRQQLMDKKRLRDFCAKRGIQIDTNYRNIELDKVIHQNSRKIEELDNVIKELIKYDPESKKIQDSVIGINYLDNA